MKRSFLLSLLALLPFLGFAQQFPLTRIQDIQGWPGQFQPDSCNDGPNPLFLDDTVRIRGVVMVNGGVTISSTNARWIWLRDITATPSTPYGHVTVRLPGATTPFDIFTAIAGDTIQVIGIVREFQGTGNPIPNNGETQIEPIPNGVTLLSEEAGPAPESYYLANLGELNGDLNTNNHPKNHLTTGEKYEGNFIEIRNVTVVSVQPDLGNDRFRFVVKDANNNHIWIYDRFKTQRPSNGFIPPNVGDQFTSIKGIVESWKNECPNTATSNRGYNLNPFSLAHYVKGVSSPSIGNLSRSVVCPTPSSAINVSAGVSDDGSITEVQVLYSLNGTNWTTVNATAAGSIYTASIPAQAAGSIVRYYFRAKDNQDNVTLYPNVPANQNPLFYVVNSQGCTIRDIQFTPYINGRSGYENYEVTVRGIVTSSAAATNLGYVHIQQPGQTEWGGIWANGGALITGFNIGDLVEVTGVVNEYFGLTRINVTNAQVISTNQTVPDPIELNPNQLTSYNFNVNEKYEGMLIRLKNPAAGQNLFVVDTNADAGFGNNGEYRVGADVQDPSAGCRILAGRQNNNSFSSLNVSYVNSNRWATQDGVMNVPVILVNIGDELTNIQGIMTYSFSNMKLLPRNNADITLISHVRPKLSSRDFKVYPNPASGLFNLQFNLPLTQAKAELISPTGQLVHTSLISGTEAKINAGTLVSGIYLLRVMDADGNLLAVRTLAIQK